MTDTSNLRSYARGHTPVPARLEAWQQALISEPTEVDSLISTYASPVNVIEPRLLARRADELVAAAAVDGIDLRVFFARKANKALSLVDAAIAAGHGVDVASGPELTQVLDRGADPNRIIVSAAVKPESLLRLAAESGVLLSVDNIDELELISRIAAESGKSQAIALRLAPEHPDIAPSRFGLTQPEAMAALDRIEAPIRLKGLHFHLRGYSAEERALMCHDAIDIFKLARARGHTTEFIDIGGGVPMSYLDAPATWQAFGDALRSGHEPLWEGHPLANLYPMWQDPVRGEWLRKMLATDGVGARLRAAGARLHIEPGRALLDGSGLTLAHVEFRKQRRDGTWLVGLAMNRTQVRSAADDFILDPILVPAAGRRPTGPIDAYLVGAYCIEDELITRRRITFPHGVAVGDVIVFPNTGGYMMHILESTSHRMPLARNVLREEGRWRLDPIDTL